jgi:hypothetical protein
MELQPPRLSRETVRIGLFVVVAVVVLTIAELTSEGFSEFTRDHALISTFITEAVLLVGVYLVIDEIVGRRQTRRWSDVTSLGIRALARLAHRPAEIVRTLVDQAAPSGGRGDYEELVSLHADELGRWLRADDARARLFAGRCARVRRVSRRRSSAGGRRSSRIPTRPSCSTCFRTSSTRRALPRRRSLRRPDGSEPS